jgi:hypothetical protein
MVEMNRTYSRDEKEIHIKFLWDNLKGGHAVVYLIEALCYKPEGRGFESRRGYWIFQLT